MPYGGIKVAEMAAKSYGYDIDQQADLIFNKYRKTHNQGVFDVYGPEIKKARHTHLITGLPDNYSRGRIIGDYRRIALYGIDYLMKEKGINREKLLGLPVTQMTSDVVQLREEVMEQYNALARIKTMALSYGFNIALPAKNAQEAIQ
jgi:formate C-acetyltransferase